ncbi:MAG: UDP-N-acetylmuramate--L-alanine ligase, partial [Lysinibacillus sp.]
VNLIDGSNVLNMETVNDLAQHKDAVFLFMGAGDVNKFQKAFEQVLEQQ